MFLEKLELQGFKSFASKTQLKFDKGMTAIVGPNGSGKSNLAEAVRWVLGEQSMKALRSKKSEDVIFAGTHQKTRLGMAEVSLFLNNEDRKAPIEYDQLVITRRVFREGASEYLINKNKARLLDIQQLLAKCGFGQRTYSVIGQGMIDSFLHASPKERKEMFEEAAGVKQYQLKKNLSINKLEQAKQNLMRVNDHLEELLPHVRSLKRQAGRALRKKEVETELRNLQKEYFNHIWNVNNKAREGNIKKSEQEKDRENFLLEALKKAEKNLLDIVQIASQGADRNRKKLSDLYQERNKLQESLAIISGRLQAEKERKTPLNLQHLQEREKLLLGEISELEKNRISLENNVKNIKDSLEKAAKEQKQIIEQIKKLKEKLIPKKATPFKLLEIEIELEEILKSEERIISRLAKVQNLNEVRALVCLTQQHAEKIKKLFVRVKEERVKNNLTNEQQQITATNQEIDKLLEKQKEGGLKINEGRVRLAVLEARDALVKEQIAGKKTEINGLQKKLKEYKDLNAGSGLSQLENEKKDKEKKLASIIEELGSIEKEVREREESDTKKRGKIIDFEKEYKKAQEELNKEKDILRTLSIEQAKLENEKTLIFDEISDDFGRALALEMASDFIKNPKKQDEKITAAQKEKISHLKKQFIQIGEIDPLVVQECKECDDRYQFLSTQKNDLESSAESLKKVISELDGKITVSFDQAIKEINDQFQKYFSILFCGGRAKIMKRKYEETHNEESDADATEMASEQKEKTGDNTYIEIKATPPGKKLQDLNMLSGGERALTSIALILAIINFNPAPFILLDEVDAALDEANAARYAKIVADVSRRSQFITITHNRETMRYAKILYGVTMEESGVSKLLSVDLEKIEK